jgi:hypothetical protein
MAVIFLLRLLKMLILLCKKEVDFMNYWLSKAAETDVTFIPVMSKSQKKKVNNTTKAAYKTRSSGTIPPSK